MMSLTSTASSPSRIDCPGNCPGRDLTRPALIFAGLWLTATVVCGAMEASPSGVVRILPEDEVKAARAENVIGPDEHDLLAVECDKPAKGRKVAPRQCRESRTH